MNKNESSCILLITCLCICVCCLLLLNCYEVHAKIRPVGFSAGKHDDLDATSWETIKKEIDHLFDYPSFTDFCEKNDRVLASYIARIGEINWNEEQQVEISKFLIKAAEKIVSDTNYVFTAKLEKILSDETDVFSLGRIVAEILFAYGRVANSLDIERVNTIWEQTSDSSDFSKIIRWSLSNLLEQQVKSEEVLPLIEKWLNNCGVDDRTILENKKQWLETYRPFVLLSETEAWGLLWDQYKPEQNDILFSGQYYGKIQSNLDSFLKVRSSKNTLNFNDDAKISYELFEQADSIPKKYFFLACTINIANRSAGNSELSEEFWDKLENSVKEMSALIRKENLYREIDARDYNLEFFENARTSYLLFKKRRSDQESEKKMLREQYSSLSSGIEVSDNNPIDTNNVIVRPEDQGEDFTPLSNSEILEYLLTSLEEPVRMKAAKILGNRVIDGSFVPTSGEQKQIDDYIVEKVLVMFKTSNPGDAGNARDQLSRLCHLAVPSLLKAAKNEDRDIAFNALDALLLIRSEKVIRGLIELYENNEDKSLRERSIRSFGMITAIHEPRLSYRPLPNPLETKKLCDELAVPFLSNILKAESDEELKELIIESQRALASPPVDSRPKIVRIEESIPNVTTANGHLSSLPQKTDVIIEQETKRQGYVLVPVVVAVIIITLLVGGIVIFIRRH